MPGDGISPMPGMYADEDILREKLLKIRNVLLRNQTALELILPPEIYTDIRTALEQTAF